MCELVKECKHSESFESCTLKDYQCGRHCEYMQQNDLVRIPRR